MEKARMMIQQEVRDINIYPGEFITVWLNRNEKAEVRNAIQVELRVTDGKLEIFTNFKEVSVLDFEYWHSAKKCDRCGHRDIDRSKDYCKRCIEIKKKAE